MAEVDAKNTFLRQQMSLMNEEISRWKDAPTSIPQMFHNMFQRYTSGGGIPPAASPPPTSEQPIQDSLQTHHPLSRCSVHPITPNMNSPGVQSKPQNEIMLGSNAAILSCLTCFYVLPTFWCLC